MDNMSINPLENKEAPKIDEFIAGAEYEKKRGYTIAKYEWEQKRIDEKKAWSTILSFRNSYFVKLKALKSHNKIPSYRDFLIKSCEKAIDQQIELLIKEGL